ncbi:hypothetical protein MPWG_00217 [Micromonas pusilla virus PL1]|nr:hypothetical protein MPWG_00217 [Micromonas pusilla virus PL1]
MNLHKRPLPRVKPPPSNRAYEPIPEGHFLYSIVNPQPTKYYVFEKLDVHKRQDYFRMLKKNNMEMGIPYVEPVLREYVPVVTPPPPVEPYLEFSDQVKVNIRVLKNGIVRVKINSAIATMFEKYKRPTLKIILQAYKAQGFSQEFLDRIKKKHQKRLEFSKKVPGIIDGIFNKEPVKKVKKVKKKPEPELELENEEEEQEIEEDVIPPEDGEMDVEVEINEEEQEEEYISDVEE